MHTNSHFSCVYVKRDMDDFISGWKKVQQVRLQQQHELSFSAISMVVQKSVWIALNQLMNAMYAVLLQNPWAPSIVNSVALQSGFSGDVLKMVEWEMISIRHND